MNRRSVYPPLPWLLGALIVPTASALIAVFVWALTDIGDAPFDGLGHAWLLLVVPLSGLFILGSVLLRRRALARFSDLSDILVSRVAPLRQALRAGLFVLALLCFILAVLGPRWGSYLETLRGFGVDIVVALDVSRSMLAKDVAPNRLERARAEIRRLTLDPSNRLGLIAFAGAASMKVPLTLDHAFFNATLDEVDPNDAPRGGTAIAEAIYTASQGFAASGEQATKVILVFTDGEDHEGDPVRAAKEVYEKDGGVVFAIGVGDPDSPTGAQVPKAPGHNDPLVHEGQIIYSKLNMEGLDEIAQAGGGQAVDVSRFTSVVNLIDKMDKTKIESEERKRFKPRYQIFLAAGLWALMLQSWIRPTRKGPIEPPRRSWYAPEP